MDRDYTERTSSDEMDEKKKKSERKRVVPLLSPNDEE